VRIEEGLVGEWLTVTVPVVCRFMRTLVSSKSEIPTDRKAVDAPP
jgi:hypothetical protein